MCNHLLKGNSDVLYEEFSKPFWALKMKSCKSFRSNTLEKNKQVDVDTFTLPKTNIAPGRRPSQKGNSSSNPSLSGAMLVSGRVNKNTWDSPLRSLDNPTSGLPPELMGTVETAWWYNLSKVWLLLNFKPDWSDWAHSTSDGTWTNPHARRQRLQRSLPASWAYSGNQWLAFQLRMLFPGHPSTLWRQLRRGSWGLSRLADCNGWRVWTNCCDQPVEACLCKRWSSRRLRPTLP